MPSKHEFAVHPEAQNDSGEMTLRVALLGVGLTEKAVDLLTGFGTISSPATTLDVVVERVSNISFLGEISRDTASIDKRLGEADQQKARLVRTWFQSLSLSDRQVAVRYLTSTNLDEFVQQRYQRRWMLALLASLVLASIWAAPFVSARTLLPVVVNANKSDGRTRYYKKRAVRRWQRLYMQNIPVIFFNSLDSVSRPATLDNSFWLESDPWFSINSQGDGLTMVSIDCSSGECTVSVSST